MALLPSETANECFFFSLYLVSSESISESCFIETIVRSGSNTPCPYHFEPGVSGEIKNLALKMHCIETMVVKCFIGTTKSR